MITLSGKHSPSWLFSFVLVPLCCSWRMFWSNRLPIMDCDEVYNYWEPLHYWLYGKGFQTWEYAHEYGLRTYAYLAPLVAASRGVQFVTTQVLAQHPQVAGRFQEFLQELVNWLVDDDQLAQHVAASDASNDALTTAPRLVEFIVFRASLAALFAWAEVHFCAALSATNVVSPTVALCVLFVMQTSAGLAHAAGALLPSTSLTLVWLLAATAFIYRQPKRFVVYAVMATLAIGWPFGVVVFVPLGLHVLLVQTKSTTTNGVSWTGMFLLLLFTAVVTTLVQGLVMLCDYEHYGIWISPTLNIFKYNAQGGGDELYGVEPTSYYIKNLLLNFNIVAVLGIMSGAVVLVSKWMLPAADRPSSQVLLVLLSPLYLWLAIVVPRPHKEERFLFPIYPLLCLGAVVTVDGMIPILWTMMRSVVLRSNGDNKNQATATSALATLIESLWLALVFIPAAGFSLFRTLALRFYYSAPLTIYAALHRQPDVGGKQVVCVCGEWYRFPSSFTLPDRMELAFLRSSFTGQLPQPFHPTHGSLAESQSVLQPFNDQNRDEPLRYTAFEKCDYLIDLDTSTNCPQRDQESESDDQKTKNETDKEKEAPTTPNDGRAVVAKARFLQADLTTMLHRAFYIPHLHEQAVEQEAVQFQHYVLYKLET